MYLLKKKTRGYEQDLKKIQIELDQHSKPLKKMSATANILTPSKEEVQKVIGNAGESKLKENIKFLSKLPTRDDVIISIIFHLPI